MYNFANSFTPSSSTRTRSLSRIIWRLYTHLLSPIAQLSLSLHAVSTRPVAAHTHTLCFSRRRGYVIPLRGKGPCARVGPKPAHNREKRTTMQATLARRLRRAAAAAAGAWAAIYIYVCVCVYDDSIFSEGSALCLLHSLICCRPVCRFSHFRHAPPGVLLSRSVSRDTLYIYLLREL